MIKENTIYCLYLPVKGQFLTHYFYITSDRIYFNDNLTAFVKINKYITSSIFDKNEKGEYATHIPNLVFRKEDKCISIIQNEKTLNQFKRETRIIKEVNEKRTIWKRVKQE